MGGLGRYNPAKRNRPKLVTASFVPMFEYIGEQIKQYCPDAWVINYTNPMSLCVKTLYRVFPEIKAFGCCLEVFGTQKLLCQVLVRLRLKTKLL